MTRLDAFKNWLLEADTDLSYDIVLRNCWQAACEWQKEKDAELWDKISNYKDYGKEADCSYAIRNQND